MPDMQNFIQSKSAVFRWFET